MGHLITMGDWHKSRLRALRYVGGKIRIAPKIGGVLRSLGGDALIDVFGGSGAVTMNAGFNKRVYNDRDGDVVNFFRVVADDDGRQRLGDRLQSMPVSREIWNDFKSCYSLDEGMATIADPVERAVAFYYLNSLSFGGKTRHGGFAVSLQDRSGCKEVRRHFSILEDLEQLGRFWKDTVIENLDFSRAIDTYGQRAESVLYIDPPYWGTERYYRVEFVRDDHVQLAAAIAACPAPAVVSYYDFPELRELYPESDGWRRILVTATKNTMGGRGANYQKTVQVDELLLVRGDVVRDPDQSDQAMLQLTH